MNVFILQHMYEHGDELQHEEIKLIGIYSSRENAEAVVDRYLNLSGFKKYPRSCFYIGEYQIDKDHWTEGFISWEDG